jgi:hypothetical protein
MRLRYSVLATGLIVGVLWAAWHLLQSYWASGVTSGELSLSLWLADAVVGTLVGQLVAYRVLMVWVYEHTQSLLLAMLMHASLAAFTFILFPPSAIMTNLISSFAYTAVLWVVVAVVALAQGGHLMPQAPLQRRAI